MEHSAATFAALGDETRLRILTRLGVSGPLSISQITSGERVTRQAITKHLHVLERARLVRSQRRGREQIWEADRQQLEAVRRYLEQVSQQWDEGLARLKAFVEHDGPPVSP